MGIIGEFQGENRFLSNFWPCSNGVVWEGICYPTSEHAYVAAKTTNQSLRIRISQMATPGQVKAYGRKLVMRSDWDSIKIRCMYEIVKAKFEQNEDLKNKLLSTGTSLLIEGNTWGDRFWGICKGEGENNLGKILMRVRSELVA